MRKPATVVRSSMLGLAIAAAVLAGCHETRAVPRIEPTLQSWDEPYRGVDGLRIHVFDTGSMSIPEAAVFRGGSWFSLRRLDVPAFVVEHPTAGLIVFDTGLSPKVREQPYGYLGWSALFGSVDAPAGADLPTQMRNAGLDPARVRYVVLSHMHFDHTGGLHGFPQASVVSARGEREEAAAGGIVDPYRPEDWAGVGRWVEIDFATGRPFATFTSHHDLLGDGSVVLVDLHGHTRGSLGVLVRAPGGPVLLAGDAAWVEESWRYPAEPIWATDAERWWQQVWRIKKLAQVLPDVLVVPGHDLSRVAKAERADLLVHRSGR